MFVREDWTQFRTLATLSQKAGVPTESIAALVAKVLVDNALDEAGSCEIKPVDGNGFVVTDRGSGIPGDDQTVGSLFSINRPLTSSKMLRLPSRGALGNGLRVVTGAVVATGGALLVSTLGRTLRLSHNHDTGDTRAENVGPWNEPGTQIEVIVGDELEVDHDTLRWAQQAICLAGRKSYTGKSSPLWYDQDAFYELLQAARGRTLRELVASLEGYSDRSAGQFMRGCGHNGELCRELNKKESFLLLDRLSALIVNPVTARQLGEVGELEGFSNHSRVEGVAWIGGLQIPVAVEAWARPAKEFSITAFVDKTPITGDVELWKSDKIVVISGCNLDEDWSGNHKPFELWFNVDTPYMPITTDGEAPNFGPFSELIKEACQKAAKRIPRDENRPAQDKQITQQEVIFQLIPECAEHAGGGNHSFNQRQLFYVVRARFKDILGYYPEWGNFCKVITDYENLHDEIPGMYRDVRGSIYHPHDRQEIPLGTLSVESYSRPEWLFNRILFIEKEGYFPILLDAEWPERHDCALLTSKGQGTRAAKDLIDLLGATEEPCEFFMIHDADAAGSMIYQCLQEATAARGARNVKIINLGLEPAEGRAMGLAVEEVSNGKRQALADYVPAADAAWLQTHRIELNAMTTPQFLDWLDRKFAKHTKLIPPVDVMRAELEENLRKALERDIINQILEEAGIDDLVEEAFEERAKDLDALTKKLKAKVTRELDKDQSQPWRKAPPK
jgi:hypothetical protein